MESSGQFHKQFWAPKQRNFFVKIIFKNFLLQQQTLAKLFENRVPAKAVVT